MRYPGNMAIPDYYVDNNETIYASIETLDSDSTGTSLTFGLSDLGELSGQSTVFVNWIQFKISGFVELDGTAGSFNQGKWGCFILPRDLSSNAYDSLADVQDIRAWPLKECFGFTGLAQGEDNPVNNRFVVSKVFRPRDALLINREQNIYMFWKPVSGPDCTVMLEMNCQFKRGD